MKSIKKKIVYGAGLFFSILLLTVMVMPADAAIVGYGGYGGCGRGYYNGYPYYGNYNYPYYNYYNYPYGYYRPLFRNAPSEAYFVDRSYDYDF